MTDQVPGFDLYLELEVHARASTPTIEAAYRSLLRRHHPDLWGEVETARMQRLNTAREWLTDPSLRERYDRVRLGPGFTGDFGREIPWPRSTTDSGQDLFMLRGTSRRDDSRSWVIAIGALGFALLVGSITVGIGTSVATVAAFALGLIVTVYSVSMAFLR